MFTTYNAIMCNKFVTYALFSTKRTNDLMVGIFKSNVNSYKFIDRVYLLLGRTAKNNKT